MSRRSPARRALARSRSSRRGRAGSRLRTAPARNGKPRDTVEQVGHPQELVIRIDKPWGDKHADDGPKVGRFGGSMSATLVKRSLRKEPPQADGQDWPRARARAPP